MSDSRIPLVVSTLALLFAVAVLIYKNAPSAHAQAPSPAAPTSSQTSAIIPIGVAPFGQGRSNPVAFFVEPSTRKVYACEYHGNAGPRPNCSSSSF